MRVVLLLMCAMVGLARESAAAATICTFEAGSGLIDSNALNACTWPRIGSWSVTNNPQTNLFFSNSQPYRFAQDPGTNTAYATYTTWAAYAQYSFGSNGVISYMSNCTVGLAMYIQGTESYHQFDLFEIGGDSEHAVLSLQDNPSPTITLHTSVTPDSAKFPLAPYTNTWIWVTVARRWDQAYMNVYTLPNLSLIFSTNNPYLHTNARSGWVTLGRVDSHTGHTSLGRCGYDCLVVDTNDNATFPLLPTINYVIAASPAYSDVTNAYAACALGYTLSVPAGSATWSNTLTITNGITLQGAGTNATVITSAVGLSSYLVIYNPATPASNEPFTLSGFTFDLATNSPGIRLTCSATNALTSMRICSNEVRNCISPTYRTLVVDGNIYGVMDHNTLLGAGSPALGFYGNDQQSWDVYRYQPGTTNTFVVENNFFRGDDNLVAAGQGGRYCLRYNTFVFDTAGGNWNALDAHGNQPSVYGTMGCEIYGNTLYATNASVRWIDHRGGVGTMWSNTVSTSSTVATVVREEYDDSIRPTTNPTPQHVSSSYYWENRSSNGTRLDASIMSDCCSVLAENVTHWNETNSFNGTSGIGVGLRSARPATCVIGVGYWATDSNILYVATAPNTWSRYYKPLAYPHPLITGIPDAPLAGGDDAAAASPAAVAGMATASRAFVGRISTP
jgi:hypothetical protein